MYSDDIRPNVPPPKIPAPCDTASTPSSPQEACGCAEGGAQAPKPRFETRRDGIDILPDGGAARTATGDEKPFVDSDAIPGDCGDGGDGGSVGTEGRKRFSIGILAFAGWTVCLLAVMWLFSLSSPFIANALVCDGWRACVSLAIGALPFLTVACILVSVLWRFRKVPSVVQFDPSKLDKPTLRKKLSAKYLRHFPSPEKYAAENGFEGAARISVIEALARLKGAGGAAYSDSKGWLDEFNGFQKLQDERAAEIVSHYWKLVGVQTAASPWKILDMISVVYNSSAMIARLAKLYNRRTSPQAAFRLVCRWLLNIFLAGELGDAAANAADTGAHAASSSLDGVAGWLAAFCKPLSSLAGKIAEGGVNAFLVFRLGRRAISFFRPLAARR